MADIWERKYRARKLLHANNRWMTSMAVANKNTDYLNVIECSPIEELEKTCTDITLSLRLNKAINPPH